MRSPISILDPTSRVLSLLRLHVLLWGDHETRFRFEPPLHLHQGHGAHARAAEGGGPSREGSCNPACLLPGAVGCQIGVGWGAALRQEARASYPTSTSSSLPQSVRPRPQAHRAPARGARGPSRGLRPGTAFRQRGGRWRHIRDCCQRPRRRRTRCCRHGGPSAAAALRVLRGGVGGVHHSLSSGRASSPPRSALRAPCPRCRSPARSLRTTGLADFSHSRRPAPPCSRGPPAAQPKCAIGRARRRRQLPPPRSHGDPRQPMQWTLGPCGTPGASTAPAPLHYKYFSKMRRSSLRAPRPPATSALRP